MVRAGLPAAQRWAWQATVRWAQAVGGELDGSKSMELADGGEKG
uniref:Uncharacterized protein n=1 Tax=Setaria italica TaxID=4555 RepID=K4A3P0_SETIT